MRLIIKPSCEIKEFTLGRSRSACSQKPKAPNIMIVMARYLKEWNFISCQRTSELLAAIGGSYSGMDISKHSDLYLDIFSDLFRRTGIMSRITCSVFKPNSSAAATQ